MNSDFPCLLLANVIQNELCREITVGTDIMHYMMSSLGLNTLEDIQQTLLNNSSGEGASLFELILFPDEGFQIAIEAIVESYNYSSAGEKTICDLLIHRKLETIFHFPNIGSTPVIIPAETIPPVITRLNLSRKTDSRITAALHLFSEEPHCSRCKIRLRNSKWIQIEAHVRLLREVIRHFAPQKDNFFEYLDIVLEFLTVLHTESDIPHSLESEKERRIHLLDMADRQDHLLRTSPMEAIMLQGIRITSIDRDEIIRQIHLLDQVCEVARMMRAK